MSDCPVCEGKSDKLSVEQHIELRGGMEITLTDYQYTRCFECGLEFISPDQARHNYELVKREKHRE